jgi:hypothetical protein
MLLPQDELSIYSPSPVFSSLLMVGSQRVLATMCYDDVKIERSCDGIFVDVVEAQNRNIRIRGQHSSYHRHSSLPTVCIIKNGHTREHPG